MYNPANDRYDTMPYRRCGKSGIKALVGMGTHTSGRFNVIAERRGQTLARMVLAWTLRLDAVTSALIGASRAEQVRENVKALENMAFTQEKLDGMDSILARKL